MACPVAFERTVNNNIIKKRKKIQKRNKGIPLEKRGKNTRNRTCISISPHSSSQMPNITQPQLTQLLINQIFGPNPSSPMAVVGS